MTEVGTEPFDQLLQRYARLVIRVGVNLQPGQRVVVEALPEQADVARVLVDEAYRSGASHVSLVYRDPHLQRAAVEHAPEDQLGRVLDHELQGVRDWATDHPAVIRLTGNPLPDLMDGLDPSRLARSAPVALIKEMLAIVSSNQVTWTVVGAPTQGWANSIGVASVAELWDAVAVAMRLDDADPEAAWRAHLEKLTRRKDLLNARAFSAVRYRGPGTDVTIGLGEESRWLGANMTSADGIDFVANMPTEEVFVSPDWRRAEGTIRTAAPFFLMSMGALVEGLELELRDGTIVGATASRGEEEVRAQFDLIPRSRHLGEVAIVDKDSRVACTGLTYKDMLFDENIGSHVAWGQGFTMSIPGSQDLSTEQRIGAGLNQASTHVDVVVGSPDVQIDGIHADRSVVPITRGDEFVLTE